jgi:predicted dehydrogenase
LGEAVTGATPSVAIVGCGLIGHKRAAALGPARLTACSDLVPERAVALAQQHGAVAVSDWRAIVERPDVVIVIVATTNDGLAPVAEAALSAGKHVLIEKPAARSVSELEGIARIAERAGRRVRIGFNHRYHPALLKARELVDGGEIGDLMYIRGRYGHGGRLGYECEWRASPERAGGGELIDQGVHLIDLARWFLGDFDTADGSVHTYFWPMAVDDNAFLLLKTTQRQTSSRSRSSDGAGSFRSTDSAAVTEWSGSRRTACCPRWGHPRPRPGSTRGAIAHGSWSLRSSSPTSGRDARRRRGWRMLVLHF